MTAPKNVQENELAELDDFLSPILVIPVRGKNYRVESVDAETGLRLQKLMNTGIKAYQAMDLRSDEIELVSDDDEPGFYKSILGDTYTELMEDRIPYTALKMIASTALVWTTEGFDMAKEFWSTQGKAPTPNRAQRRTATQTRTGEANTTRKPASRSTTSTQKKAKGTSGKKS